MRTFQKGEFVASRGAVAKPNIVACSAAAAANASAAGIYSPAAADTDGRRPPSPRWMLSRVVSADTQLSASEDW